jgi:hypothetical protein
MEHSVGASQGNRNCYASICPGPLKRYMPCKIFQHHIAIESYPFNSLIQSIITSTVWSIPASYIGPQNSARMTLSIGLC